MTESTHDLDIGEHEVVKTFRSWKRGEPDREWEALGMLHETAPGLAPRPVARRSVEGRPAVVMTRLPGEPLGGAPLSERQTVAVATAMTRLHTVVPSQRLRTLPPRLWAPAEAVADLREAYAEVPPPGLDARVTPAVAAARHWLESEEAALLAEPAGYDVFAQADGNLANFLWDGAGCRLVDFEDSGVSDRAFEVADLVEHVSVTLTGVVDADRLVEALDLDGALCLRVRRMRRLFATFWLHRLLPGNPGHRRNPPGSVERQAARTLALLA